MRIFQTMAVALVCCVGGLNSAGGAETQLGLKGQLYFDSTHTAKLQQSAVPRHVARKHVARTPVDFSYPETAASTGTHVAYEEPPELPDESPWQLQLSDGAKLRYAYDKDTKLKLGMGVWQVKVGVSKAFGGPRTEPWTFPVRTAAQRPSAARGTAKAGTR